MRVIIEIMAAVRWTVSEKKKSRDIGFLRDIDLLIAKEQ